MDELEFIQIPRLEELSYLKIAIRMWSKESFQLYSKIQTNGLVYLDKPLEIIKKSIDKFELASSMKRSLIDICERVGYELYIFLSESTLNTSNPKHFLQGNFSNYTVYDINLSTDLKWTIRGEISVTNTLSSFVKNHPNASPFLLFTCACENCDEYNVMLIWNKLSYEQKEQIKNSQCWSKNYFFLNYWLCLLHNNCEEFIRFYGNKILTFNDRQSLNYNLLLYSIMRCFRSNIKYFYSKLTENEKVQFSEANGSKAVLMHVMQIETFWYVRYINKFFEVPLVNYKINKFIIAKLSKYSFKDLIEFNIQQVNSFGDLHGNIIFYLLATATDETKTLVFNMLNFYVLSLIHKGCLRAFEPFLNEETKGILYRQILDDFQNLSFSKYSRICMNGHSDLLAKYFDMVADKDEDRLFLANRLKSINEGTQYEDL